MGWPRKNESCRLYRERADKSYLLVILENGRNGDGTWGALANAYAGPEPSLCTTGVSDLFLRNSCKRVAWDDLPVDWQETFRAAMREWDTSDPKQIRGFWRVRKA